MENGWPSSSPAKKKLSFYLTAIFFAGILMYATQYFITDAIFMGLFELFGRGWIETEWLWVLVLCGMYLLTIAIPGVFLLIVFKEKPFAGWKLTTACPKFPFLFIPAVIGGLYVLNFGINVLLGDLLAPFDTTLTADDFVKTPVAIAIYFVYAAVMPALLEEWFFRGLVQKKLISVVGDRSAIVLSAFLFGMMHLDPGQSIFAFGFGLLAGYAYSQTGSIWFGALIHMLNNAIAIGMGYWYLVFNAEDMYEVLDAFTLIMMGVGIAGLIVYRITAKNRRINLVQRERMLPGGAAIFKKTITNPCLYLMIAFYCFLLWAIYIR